MAATEKKGTPEMNTRAPVRGMKLRAVIVLLLIVFIAFGGVIGQLFHWQIQEGDSLQQEAVAQQLSDTVTSPNRGKIFDRNGSTLVESQLVWTVIMSPAAIETEEERLKIADDVSALLEVDRDTLYAKTQKTYSQFEYVKKKIPRAKVEELATWVSEQEMGGVFRVITDYKRVYPYGSLASTVLGFTGAEGTGLYGLEALYESTLAGEAGRVITTQNGWGEKMPNTLSYEKTIDATDGSSLVLTIDQTIQHYAEKYLEEAVKATGCTNRGLAVVMDVNTGGILALAVKGDYDPNDPFTIADPDVLAELAELAGDEESAARSAALQKQWNNKVVYDFYEPGSVFKVFTSCMGIEEGIATENTSFHCGGSLTVLGQKMNCHVYPSAHGTQTFAQAISNSCNPAFMNLGLSIGAKNFFKYFVGFGFTELTGIDMLGESQVTSALYYDDTMGDVSLATNAIGQTFKIPPIQMITAMCSIANGGKLVTPYVVSKVLDADGNVVSETQPQIKRQIISADTSRHLCDILGDIVNGGGSKNAYVAGYRVAGKTGTSEKRDTVENEDDVVASFSGFAPADDPKVAVLVLLDDPQTAIRYGGTLSAPVAQKIFESILPHLGIEPSYTADELASLSRTVPSAVGQTATAAQTKVVNAGLKAKVVGDGDKVVRQVPEAGQSIPAGGTVLLYTEEEDLDMVTVPNFVGRSVTEVNSIAAQMGINVQMTGLVGGSSAAASANSQSVRAGTKVPRGTVIKVNFVYTDTREG